MKVDKIRNSLGQTKKRRKDQVAYTYQLKLQNLTDKDKKILDRLFLEAKWFYNYIIADIEKRLTSTVWKLNEVEIKTHNGIEKRVIGQLSGQMKQGIVERIKRNLYSLKKAKEKGLKVGKLQFKSEVRSLPLVQYGKTYKIDKNNNKIRIQKIKKKFRVLGLHQVSDEVEFSGACLIKKPSGYYLHIVCYLPKEKVLNKIKENQIRKPIGVDLGIKHQVTLSNGEKIDWYIPETKRLKKLQRELSRKKFGSRNYYKVKQKIKKEWEYITNKRKDTLNKVVGYLKRFSLIAIQDDPIEKWKESMFGKQIQNTGIGGITARLKNLATLIPVFFVDRYEPTTQTCSFCGYRQKISLNERIFRCKNCGKEIDRDINSARNILQIALKRMADPLKSALPVGCGEVTPVEKANAFIEAGSLN